MKSPAGAVEGGPDRPVAADPADSAGSGASDEPDLVDVVCVGAGFAGLYAAHKLVGAGFTVAGYEAGPDVGGTWLWNRYPGARCDIESVHYSYSFSEELEQEWVWTEKYATQPEILRYLEHVADRCDLRRHFSFDTTVVSATWDEATSLWQVRTDRGASRSARFVILATGCLSTPKEPEIEGVDEFAGITLRTGTWPADAPDLAGRTIGVIGTGSSGVQCIPILARDAKRLTVFQRTANYCLPARNEPLSADYVQAVKQVYPELRARARASTLGIPEDRATDTALSVGDDERERRYEEAWQRSGLTSIGSVFADLLESRAANETAAEFIRDKVRQRVRDPRRAEQLLPVRHPFGAKRTCLETNYYETFNQDNVELIDIRSDPIVKVTATGVETRSRHVDCEVLVLATGFDAITGTILRMDIRRSSGETLREAWRDGPHTYLGLMTAGFPNLFLITGPGSPSVLSNVVHSIEQHVEWVVTCLEDLRAERFLTIESDAAADATWTRRVLDGAAKTLYVEADSWYRGANVPGKPVTFMAFVEGVAEYRRICDQIVESGYVGFRRGPGE